YFDIGADLTAQTQAQQGYATADASSTGLFSLQVLTPGGGYTSQGGVVFATSFSAAPEPGTLALGGLGCLFLLLAARKS
ncbi:MAG TPA: PEP-CTERM sorting domain-containing protein, partial [Candidatus Sulfopaludibacter sp.]|nr:PEP-CTERM sorting domain-containing protein [Candidatus Sulfopaludibacter sp.]